MTAIRCAAVLVVANAAVRELGSFVRHRTSSADSITTGCRYKNPGAGPGSLHLVPLWRAVGEDLDAAAAGRIMHHRVGTGLTPGGPFVDREQFPRPGFA